MKISANYIYNQLYKLINYMCWSTTIASHLDTSKEKGPVHITCAFGGARVIEYSK